VVVDSPTSVDLNDLDRHARPARGSAADGGGRRNLHGLIGRVARGSMIEIASSIKLDMGLLCPVARLVRMLAGRSIGAFA